MADIKISALPAAASILGGEILPIVQSGITKEVAFTLLKSNIIASVPTITSIYTGSGDVADTGVATVRNFKFLTDADLTYNPSANYHDLRFNSYFNAVGGSSTQAGAFGMKASATGSNKLAAFNMYGTSTPSAEMIATDTTSAYVRKLFINSDKLELSTTFISGLLRLTIDTNGLTITDSRPSPFGLQYLNDYSVALSALDRSVPDVGTVKILRQQTNTWTTGTRPTAVAGQWGLNTTTSKFEGYTGAAWVDFH